MAFSGGLLTTSKERRKMAFLDMSLDEIIILKNIKDTDTEENTKGQNYKKETSDSSHQSSRSRHDNQKGHSRFRNKIEENNYDKKAYQESSRDKPGQSLLNKKTLSNQEECNGDNKAQTMKRQGRFKEDQTQWKGSQDRFEENRHHSKKYGCHSERSYDQTEKFRGYTERSYGLSERLRDQSERSLGHFERYYGYTERFHDQSERYYGHSERFRNYSERAHDHFKRSYDQVERSYGQPGSYRRYSPLERFKTSSKIEPEIDRHFTIEKRNDYFQKEMQYRNRHLYRKILLENDHNTYENGRRHERRRSSRDKTPLKNTVSTITKSHLRQPRGIYLKFNFQAMGNQTKLSLNERFSNLKVNKGPDSVTSTKE